MPPSPRFRLTSASLCGALVLALALLSPMADASAQTAAPITITLADYTFSPGTLHLKQGTTYQLHFTNNGSKGHNFTAPEFFAASQMTPDDMAKVRNGTVELGDGQSVDIAVTPSRAGTYGFSCTHFMHKMLGMHGEITVQ
jgi:uncharacterized cupredoxin-like copper-binding protein